MLWERLLRRISYWWVIGAVVLVVTAVNVGWATRHHPHETVPLALLSALPLLGLRRQPLLVLGVELAVLIVSTTAYGWANPFPLWLSVCTVATYTPRRTSLLATLPALAFAAHDVGHPASAAGHAVTIAVAWVLGDTLRARRLWLDEERAQHLKRAAESEQARIARELHDVI